MAVACAALFIVPSAWIVQKHLPRWLALAVGLAAFPVVPGVWHLLGERARRRSGAKSGLTGGDRWLLRLIAVAVVAIVPLVAFSRGPTWRAIKHHGLWFASWGGGPSGELGAAHIRDSALAKYVPEDAGLIAWMRVTDDLAKALGQNGVVDESDSDDDNDDDAASAKKEQAKEVLFAMRGEALLLAIRTDDDGLTQAEVDKAGEQLGEQLFGKPIKLVLEHPGGDVYLVVSDTWQAAVDARAKGGKAPEALFTTIDGLPTDALIVAAERDLPPIAGAPRIAGGTATVRVVDQGVRIDASAQLASAAEATALRTALRAKLEAIGADSPDQCKEPIEALRRAMDLGGDGERVTFTFSATGEQLMRAMFCRMGSGSSE